jgi:hypothetical protein
MPIWPILKTKKAKENFIRFIVDFDLTNCRPYDKTKVSSMAECQNFSRAKESFSNLCQGYATQMYTRYYNDTKRLKGDDLANLQSIGHIYENNTAAKFRMPIFIATYPGHAFNAILVDKDSKDINSYLFLEPQNDQLFDANSPIFKSYGEIGTIELSKLTSFNKKGQYGQTTVADFLKDSKGVFLHQNLTATQRMAFQNTASDIFIANDPGTWKYTIEANNLTFEKYIDQQQKSYKYSDEVLAFVAKFLIGRKFKRSPNGKEEVLTRETFIKLMNRPSLKKFIPAK